MRGRGRRRRKPELSNDELSKIAYGLNNFGDMLVMLGEIEKREKEVSKLDKLMEKFFRADNREVISAIENNPELIDKAAALAEKWEALSSIMENDPLELSPDERIEAGKSLKEFSSLLKEIVEGMEEE
ncbi:MAG: hypothetical protein KAU16_02265 [Methanophagales archaeon]|nr:hypothetical protein [Methanophagales archaeon]